MPLLRESAYFPPNDRSVDGNYHTLTHRMSHRTELLARLYLLSALMRHASARRTHIKYSALVVVYFFSLLCLVFLLC